MFSSANTALIKIAGPWPVGLYCGHPAAQKHTGAGVTPGVSTPTTRNTYMLQAWMPHNYLGKSSRLRSHLWSTYGLSLEFFPN